ncbi:MAG: outer membrane protein assembly factor [Gemmatimonadales bacterium]
MRGLSFSGNHAIDDLTLKASIGTSESALFARWPTLRWIGLGAKRYFDETEFRRDVFRITAVYRASGYREAVVDTVVRRENGAAYIKFIIDEGRPVRVTSLRVTGLGDIIPERSVVGKLPLKIGRPFNLALLQASVDTIRTVLRNRGYPFPEVLQNFNARLAQYSADVTFEALPGRRATIASVEIVGARNIDEAVIRRALAVKAGDLYSERKLLESRLALYRTNLFNFVGVELTDSLPSTTADSSVTVRVRVTEGSLRRIRFGAGYGTIDCFRTLAGWTAFDFLGDGRTLDISARTSKLGVASPLDGNLENGVCAGLKDEDPSRLKLNFNVTTSLREPFFFSRKLSATVSFTGERHSEFQAFLRESVGGRFAVTWLAAPNIPVTTSYALSGGKTDADPATFCSFLNVCQVEDTRVFQKFRRRSMLELTVVWDRSDSPLDPTRGTRLTGDFRYASTAIGSDELIQFVRGVVEFASYHRVARRTVLAWRVRVGSLGAPKNLETGRVFVPPEDRFYGGGPNSVRGFGQNELGSIVRVLDTVFVDTNFTNGGRDTIVAADSIIRTSATGGNQLFFANVELRFPLPALSGRLFGAIFADAGQVYERGGEDVNFADMRITPGVGLRLATPLGPVRLDIAYNPYEARRSPLFREVNRKELVVAIPDYVPRRTFLDRLRLHFSVGQAF